jgi:hypothetical protein
MLVVPIARAVSCRLVTVELRVQSQGSPCEICEETTPEQNFL